MIFNDIADDRSNNEDGAGRAVLRVYSVDYSAGAPLPQVLAFRLRLPFFGWSTLLCCDYLLPRLLKLIF